VIKVGIERLHRRYIIIGKEDVDRVYIFLDSIQSVHDENHKGEPCCVVVLPNQRYVIRNTTAKMFMDTWPVEGDDADQQGKKRGE
jgi:hypothetical protein